MIGGDGVKVEMFKINDLKEYENNAKIHTDKQIQEIANSITEFGFNDPIGIWSNENIIVEGHGRYAAAKRLGIKEVPCIRLDHMNDEQRKAYTLAHNQTNLSSGFDLDVLELELNEIKNFNMEDFGFQLKLDVKTQPNEDDDEEEEKQNERHRTMDYYNLYEFDEYDCDGFYEMPMIYNDNVIPDDLVDITSMNVCINPEEYGMHMFVDDYRFERLWNQPYQYLEKLKKFKCIFTPDFSLYLDMPMAMKIWNVYRSRLLGQLWQRNDIKVIPTISWAEAETFSFCFDGIEEGSIVAISTIGVKKDDYAFDIWCKGCKAMIEKIKPSMILVYGGMVEFDYGDIEVKYFENKATERLKALRNEV